MNLPLPDAVEIVAAKWPRWRERAARVLWPVGACDVNLSSRLELCASTELSLAYQPIAKTASAYVRTALHARYGGDGLSCPGGSHAVSSIDRVHNATTRGWAWFSFVRDPIERFLSAVGEVSFRQLPHPPVERLANGSWVLRPSWNTSLPPMAAAGRFPANRTFRANSHGVAVSTYYPASPRDRLAMLEFLVVGARPRWDDIHFRSQWVSLRSAAAAVPKLVSRGFVGDTCRAGSFFNLLQANESVATRVRRDASSWAERTTASGAKVVVHHTAESNRRRHLSCDQYNHTVGNVTTPNHTTERDRLRCIAAAKQADLDSPYPDEEMERRIRQHYLLDYECLGLDMEADVAANCQT